MLQHGIEDKFNCCRGVDGMKRKINAVEPDFTITVDPNFGMI